MAADGTDSDGTGQPGFELPDDWPLPANSALPWRKHALEGIGRSKLQDHHTSEGTACLLQALAIHQRIGSPAARRVQQSLHDHHARQDSLTPLPER